MFEKIIQEFISLKKETTEFEIRFGKFNEKKHFESNVDISFFYRLKTQLKNQNNNTNHTYSVLVDSFYKHDNTMIRETKDKNNISIITKKYIKYHNELNYDIRFSISSEEKYTSDDYKNDKKILIRNKERHSYYFNCGKIDLTKVKEQNLEKNTHHVKYEVEFEILDHQDISSIMNILYFILQIKNDNYYIIDNNESKKVLAEYQTLTKSNYFIGCQPETLQRDNLNIFYNELYSVTQKVDGERFFLFVTSQSDIYLIDSNLKILKTNLKSRGPGPVLIDGELVRTSQGIHFMAFDLILFFDNTNVIDVRGNEQYNLITRTHIVKQIINDCYHENCFYLFTCKEYIWKNVFAGCEIILNNTTKEFDGLIFTPINEPYPQTKKWTKLLKWKPKEFNTIDFYSIYNKQNNEWELYVQDVNTETKKIEIVLFDINNPRFKNFDTKSELVTFKTTFDPQSIDPSTLEHFKSHTVIEYKWDYTLKKFKPLRTRWDKTVNSKKRGNFSSVAYSIWNNIINPVEPELFCKLKNLNIKDDIYFKNMRRLHNKIKEVLYNNYAKNSDRHLELCIGKGVDMQKWYYNNVKYLCGYDISEKNIAKCNEKLQKDKPYHFYKLDLQKQDAAFIIKQQNELPFSTISCQFSIQYFFSSQNTFDNFINIIDKNLHENGTFMITYLDSSKINISGLSYKLHDGNIVYTIKNKKSETLSPYGSKLKISLEGDVLHGNSDEFDEYAIDSEFLISYMKQKGYSCVEQGGLHHSSITLNEYEQEMNHLYVFNVFKKDNQHLKTIAIQKPNESLALHVKDNRECKLHPIDEDLTLLKITHSHDIVNLLNCESYFFNKKTFEYMEITDIQLLTDMLQKYNIKLVHINSIDKVSTEKPLINTFSKTFTLYLYTNTYMNTNTNGDTEMITHFYIVLYKNTYIFELDEAIHTKLLHFQTEVPELTELTNSMQNVSLDTDTEIQTNTETEIQTEMESENKKTEPTTIDENNVSNLKQKLLDTLKNKITIKVLKECILDINEVLNKKIKITGSKEILIERVNEILNTL